MSGYRMDPVESAVQRMTEAAAARTAAAAKTEGEAEQAPAADKTEGEAEQETPTTDLAALVATLRGLSAADLKAVVADLTP